MRNLNLITLLICLSLMLVACTDGDETANDPKQWEEGELTEARLALVVNDYVSDDSNKSRTESPESYNAAATEEEKLIRNLWVFQYDDATGNKLINPRYYTITNQDELKDLPVLLKAEVSSTIYVVTNTNSDTWAKNNDAFNTLSGLKAQTIPSPNPQSKQSATLAEQTICIPMGGSVSEKTVDFSSTTPIEISVTRMYAKLVINPKVILSGMQLSSVEVNNISWSCQVASRYDYSSGEGPQTAYPTADEYWITRAVGNTDEYIVYMPENIQGENGNISGTDKIVDAPARALKVTFHTRYVDPITEAIEDYDYVLYPGGNEYNNYNIRRNCIYQLNVKINTNDTKYHIPSSNCFVMTPGQTISFVPYNRVETGGGFNIKDYLDADDPEGKKVIKGVKILWQTVNDLTLGATESAEHSAKTVIGDNSAGNLVWYDSEKKKIYVKTRNEGNALIGAYNEDGTILWSWHIWCRNDDPSNVANAKVYSTYSWDNDGIHTNKERIPGYAIMPCNLGAMINEPADKNDLNRIRTGGLLYQWGRKDPFPSAFCPNTDDAMTYHSQEVIYMTDNENKHITFSFTKDINSDDPNNTFHVASGETIKQMHDDGTSILQYSIEHPVVFLAGTKAVKQSANYVEKMANYYYDGDWLPEHNNKLWGGLDPNDDKTVMKSYTPYSSYPDNTFYDNYGNQKSIFDPCPKGWRVPPPELWIGFTSTGINPTTMNQINFSEYIMHRIGAEFKSSSGGMYMFINGWQTGNVSYFPEPGIIRADGNPWGVGCCGNYNSASSSRNNVVNCLHIHISATAFRIFEHTYQRFRRKAMAGPVRCVRDTK